jgi:DNA-binding MarR family transcriptional regulator
MDSDRPSDSPPLLERRLPPLLRKAWFGLNQAFRQRISPIGLTPDQFSVLRWISESPDGILTQTEITAAMASDPNTIASLVRRMEQSGLVTRGQHARDARAKAVTLTPQGHDALQAASEIAIALQHSVLACLPASRRDSFLADLLTVGEACQAANRSSPR